MHIPNYTLALGIALFSSASHAWRWSYESVDGENVVKEGEDVRKCSRMDMKRGASYTWDPEASSEEFCVHLFSDHQCKNQNGFSCKEWGPRELGQDKVGSYLINRDPDDMSSGPKSTGTETGTGTMTGTASESTKTGDTTTTDNSKTHGQSSQLTQLTSMPSSLSPSSAPLSESTAAPTATGTEATASGTGSPTASTSEPADGSGSTLSGGTLAEVVVGAVAGIALMGLY